MKSLAKIAFGFASVFCACSGSSTPTAGTETWTVHISGNSITSGSGSLTFSSNGTWKGSWVVEYTGSPPGTVTCPIDSGTFVSTADGSLSAEGYGTATNPNTPVPNSPFVLRLDGQVADDGTAFGTWTITYDNWPMALSGTWVALLANGSGVLAVRPSGPGTGGAGGGVRPVLAGNGGGLLGGSPGLDAGASPPLAPSNLTAITSWTEIDLSWLDNANNETGFKIESSRGSTAGYTELASLQPDATSYSNKGLLPDTTYYYRIYEYNDSGNSTYLQANFTTKSCSTNRDCPAQLNCYQSMCQSPELTPPQAPSNFKVTSLWTEVDFTWTDNANNEESFKVERSTGDAGYVLVTSLPPDTTAYSDTGLLPGTGYHYRIYAHNAVGDSASYGVGATTQSCGSNTDCPAANTCNSAGACVGATPVSPGDGGLPDGSPSIPDLAPSRPDLPLGPLLKFSPSFLNFNEVDVGQPSPALTVTVTNSGALTALTPTVDVAAFNIIGTTCSTPAASCTISVVFTPASATVASGTLIVAPGITVPLSGTGTPPRAFTATASAIPGTVLANQAVPFTVTVTATGAIPGLACVPSSANVTADPTKTTCAATVPANSPCAFGFTFKAATAGNKTETIVCSGSTTVRNVTVTTTVVTPPILTIAPSSASFSADVGATSQVAIFSVGNAGGTASGVLTKVIGGANATEFVITNDGCVLPLDSLDTCTIQVAFKPTTPGTGKAATITVSDPTGGSAPASATMSGVATPGTVGVVIAGTPNLGSVQVGQAGTASVFTITNRGVAATGALALATDDAEFAIDSDACSGLSLAASATCTFTVTFTPTTASAKYAVVTAKSGTTVLGTLMISGTGTSPPPAPPALSMTPTAGLSFGKVAVGKNSPPQSFTVTNTGGRATGVLTVLPAGSAASKFSYTNGCVAALAPNDTCQVVVIYKPTAEADDQATFTVTDGTYLSPARTVTGTGVTSPGLNITCTSAGAFGDTVVGQTSTVKVTCTVSNDSTSPLATGALTFTMTGDFATTATTGDCSGKSLGTTDQCPETVVFKPTTVGDLTGSIKVTGANGGTDTATLTGTSLAIIEIQKFTLSGTTPGTTPTAVSADPYVFPNAVSVGATSTSDTNVVLAVFVRAAATVVGDMTVTSTTIATAAGLDFKQVAGAVDATWPNGGGRSSRPACSIGTAVSGITPSLYVPYCTVVVSFTPQATGTRDGAITASGSVAGTAKAKVEGTAGGPVSIHPSTLNFDPVAVGAVGTAMTLTVCNTGSTDATVKGFTITGNSQDFAVTLDEVSYSTITANGGCNHLAFRLDIPGGTAAGALTATVTVPVTIGTASQPSLTATLAGTVANAAALTVSPASPVAFADTAVTATTPVTFTIRNTGATASDALTFTILDGSEFRLLPPGSQSQGNCVTGTCTAAACTGKVLAASGDNCTLKVWFEPTGNLGLGARSDTLMVGGDNAGTNFVTLTGNATSQLTATPATSVVNGDTTIATITVANHGAAIPDGLTVTLDDDVNFQKVSNTCLDPLDSGPPAPTCTVGVELTTGAAGDPATHSTVVRVINGSNGQMATVVVTGTGSSAANLHFSPATNVVRDFGAIRRGTTSASIKYTVTNVGGVTSGKMTFGVFASPVTAGSSASTDFTFATGTTCVSNATTGTALAPGASCDIMLAFSPTTDTVPTELSESLVVRADPGAATSAGLQSPVINALATVSAVVYMVTSAGATPANAAPYDFGNHTISTTTAQMIQLAIHNAGTTAVRALPPTFKNVADATTNDEFAVVAGVGMGNCDFSGTGMALDPNQVCTFTAGWTPGATLGPGPRAVVASSTMASAAVASMVLFGRVPGPAVLTATPTSFEFGDVPQDLNSPTLTVVVKNTSEWNVHGNLGVTKTGAAAAQAQLVSSTCDGAPLLAGATCNVVARVNPTDAVAGPLTVAFTVQSALAGEMISIPVHWNGMNLPQITPNPTSYDFNDIAVLTTSGTHAFTLSNINAGITGNSRMPTGPLTFTIVGTDAADFAVHAGTTGLTECGHVRFASNGLDPTTGGNGGVCSVTVTFTPRTSGGKSATLKVTSTSGVQATVGLTSTATTWLAFSSNRVANDTEDRLRTTGTGAGCTLNTAGTTSTCAYGGTDISTATRFDSETFIFQNNGGEPTGLLMASLTGTAPNAADDVAQFKIVSDGCSGTSVNSGATCPVTVRFQPVAASPTSGLWTVTLTVQGTPGDSASVTLTGNGT